MSDSFRLVAGISVLFLLGALISWLSLDPLKYLVIEKLGDGDSISTALQAAIHALRPFDLILLSTAVVLGASLVILEIRDRRISAAIGRASPAGLWLLLTAMLVWLCHAYLVPGSLVGGDATSHVGRIAHGSMALLAGELISWNNYYYAGSTFLEYTGPLYFWAGAALNLVIRDADLTSKLVLFGCSVASGLAFYWCLSEHQLSRYGSAIGALVYAGSYAHLHQLLWDGNHPQAITMVLAPLALVFLHRCLRRPELELADWCLLTLVNAALLVNHQSMGKQFGLLFIVYTLMCLAFNRDSIRRIPVLAASALASLLAASGVIVPIMLDHEWVMMYEHPRILDLDLPAWQYFRTLFLWNISPNEGAAYVGTVSAFLAAFGIWCWIRARSVDAARWLLYTITLCLLISFVIRGSHVKHIVVTLFFVAFLAGIGADLIRENVNRTWVLPAVSILLVIDLSSTSIMPINRLDKDYLYRAGAYLQDNFAGYRILGTRTWGPKAEIVASIGPGASITSYYAVQHATGAHNLAATRVHNYMATVIKMTEEDLRKGGELSETTRNLLCLFNVRLIVNDNGASMGFPAGVQSNHHTPELGNAILLDDCSPFVFAPSVNIIDGTSSFDKPMLWNENFESVNPQVIALRDDVRTMPREMHYDRRSATALRLAIRDLGFAARPSPPEPVHVADTQSFASQNTGFVDRPTIDGYRVGFDTVDLSIVAPVSGYLQVPHAWYPSLRVIRNGETVSNYASAQYLTVIPVVNGRNEIHLEYTTSGLRIAWLYVSLIVTLGTFGLLLYSYHRSRNTAIALRRPVGV